LPTGPCLVAGMDVLRHGAVTEMFGGVRAPSAQGSFLRSFTWGTVRPLDAVGRRLLARLASAAPAIN